MKNEYITLTEIKKQDPQFYKQIKDDELEGGNIDDRPTTLTTTINSLKFWIADFVLVQFENNKIGTILENIGTVIKHLMERKNELKNYLFNVQDLENQILKDFEKVKIEKYLLTKNNLK